MTLTCPALENLGTENHNIIHYISRKQNFGFSPTAEVLLTSFARSKICENQGNNSRLAWLEMG